MQPCLYLAFIAAMVNFQFRLLTIRTSSYFFADLLPSQSVPILCCCMGLCHPSCRTFPSFLFNFLRLLLSVACLGIWIAALPSNSIPFSKLLMKMLTVPYQVSTPEEHYLDFELLTTTLFFFPTHWKLQVFYPILLHMVWYGMVWYGIINII